MAGGRPKTEGIHTGHRDRVKQEFLARGTEGWPDHRVLELLLFYTLPRGDVNPLAHRLIERFGSLAGVLDASVEELMKVPGVGEHTAILLHLMTEIGARYIKVRSDMNGIIHSASDAEPILRPYFYGARNEMVYILCVDGKRKLLGVRKVAEGSIQSAEIGMRRVAEEALGLRAAGLYLAHNHVSNLALPSDPDWMSMDILRATMSGIGIEVYDHLIFVDDDVVSLEESERCGTRRSYQYY